MTLKIPRLQCESVVLLVVDLQERLLPAMHEGPAAVEAARRLIESAKILQIPVVLTEQYPAGLGQTCAAIRQAVGPAAVEKTRFTACVEPVWAQLSQLKRQQVVVMGIEAHVCGQQTVLDLLGAGYQAYVCADATASRRPFDRDIALERMRQAGAIVTTSESVIYELLGEAGTERFKQVLKIVK